VNQYQAQIELLDRPLAQLEKQYREALERNLKIFQEAGDLDWVVAYTSEVERLLASSRAPHGLSEAASLAKLQAVFRDNYLAKEETGSLNAGCPSSFPCSSRGSVAESSA